MYRCPTCVSIIADPTVRRCPVCSENFKRRRPEIIGLKQRGADKMTSWDLRANAEANRIYGQESDITPDIDLPTEHLRDSSGRTAGAERG
jgi:hypothetical protein